MTGFDVFCTPTYGNDTPFEMWQIRRYVVPNKLATITRKNEKRHEPVMVPNLFLAKRVFSHLETVIVCNTA